MSLLLSFARLSLNCITSRSVSTAPTMLIRATPILCAEPLKKKKRIDPQVIKAREERRRKKLEKQIKRLEKNARQLKPIDELEIPLVLIDEKQKRTRPIINYNTGVFEQRALLEKNWTRHKMQEKLQQYQIVDKLLLSQQKALQELRYESEDLYLEAVQLDLQLLPFKFKGPVATPPVKDYESPDGEYLNITKKWE